MNKKPKLTKVVSLFVATLMFVNIVAVNKVFADDLETSLYGAIDSFDSFDSIDSIDISSLGLNFDQIARSRTDNSELLNMLLSEQQGLLLEEFHLTELRDELVASGETTTLLNDQELDVNELEELIQQKQMRFQEIEREISALPDVVLLSYEDLTNIGLVSSRMVPVTPGSTTNVQYTGQMSSLNIGGRNVNFFTVTAIPRNINNRLTFEVGGIDLLSRQSHTRDQLNRTFQTFGNFAVGAAISNPLLSIMGASTFDKVFAGRTHATSSLELRYSGSVSLQFTFVSFDTTWFTHMQTSQSVRITNHYRVIWLDSLGRVDSESANDQARDIVAPNLVQPPYSYWQ